MVNQSFWPTSKRVNSWSWIKGTSFLLFVKLLIYKLWWFILSKMIRYIHLQVITSTDSFCHYLSQYMRSSKSKTKEPNLKRVLLLLIHYIKKEKYIKNTKKQCMRLFINKPAGILEEQKKCKLNAYTFPQGNSTSW